MQENLLTYEYAVIRLVPKVEREEFLNIGIILFCPKEALLRTKFYINKSRLEAFSSEIDFQEIENYLNTWEKICVGGKSGGTIGSFTIASRFRWLTATRSTILQTSKVHPGFTKNASETLEYLFEKLVK